MAKLDRKDRPHSILKSDEGYQEQIEEARRDLIAALNKKEQETRSQFEKQMKDTEERLKAAEVQVRLLKFIPSMLEI